MVNDMEAAEHLTYEEMMLKAEEEAKNIKTRKSVKSSKSNKTDDGSNETQKTRMIKSLIREAFEALANAYDLAFLDEQRQEIRTAYKLLKAALLQIDGGKYLPKPEKRKDKEKS